MNDVDWLELEPKMQAAADELTALVRARYPEAQFRLSRSEEDSAIIHLTTIVDVDDPDEVADLVIERMNELLVDEDLPIFVIPIRTPDRVAALLEAARAKKAARVFATS